MQADAAQSQTITGEDIIERIHVVVENAQLKLHKLDVQRDILRRAGELSHEAARALELARASHEGVVENATIFLDSINPNGIYPFDARLANVLGMPPPGATTLTVQLRERDGGGWAATVDEVPGSQGHGDTAQEARIAALEAAAGILLTERDAARSELSQMSGAVPVRPSNVPGPLN